MDQYQYFLIHFSHIQATFRKQYLCSEKNLPVPCPPNNHLLFFHLWCFLFFHQLLLFIMHHNCHIFSTACHYYLLGNLREQMLTFSLKKHRLTRQTPNQNGNYIYSCTSSLKNDEIFSFDTCHFRGVVETLRIFLWHYMCWPILLVFFPTFLGINKAVRSKLIW